MLYTFNKVALFHNFPYSEATQLTDRKCFIRKVTDVTNITKKTNFRDRRNTYEDTIMIEVQTDQKKSTWQNMYKMNKHMTVIHEVSCINIHTVQSKPVPSQYQKVHC
jgi:hypothetical protein